MTETYEPEMRRFRELMEGPRAEMAARATTALEQRNLEEFQRIMAERSKVVAPRDPETRMLVHSTELGEPGLPDAWVRARVAVADTREERLKAFNQIYPVGEIRPARDEAGAKFEIYRRDPAEPWRKFDPPIMEKFEPIEDIADFASSVLPVAGEIAATRGAGGLIRRTAQTAAGAAGGEVVEEALEAAGGQQLQGPGEIAGQAGQEFLTAGLGSVASEPLSMILNAFRGSGALRLLPGAREAIEAQQRQGLPEIMPFQAAEDPIVRTMGSQAQALAGSIEQFAINQEAGAATRMQYLAQAAGDPERLPDLLRARTQAARGELDDILERPNIELKEGGEALQKGLQEYDQIARTYIDDLYTKARSIEDPTFDIQGLKRVAEELDAGIQAMGAEGTIQVSGPLPSELRAVIADIRALADDMQPVTIQLPDGTEKIMTPTDQLRALRERLWDLKTVDAGQIARRPELQAGRLYGAITDVLEKPQAAAEGFEEAWGAANAAAKDRFATWERAVIRTTAKNETPTILAHNYAKPLQVDNLHTLRETIPAENWQTFQGAVKAEFLGDLPGLTARLDSFDQPTLNMLVPHREQMAMRLIGRNFDRMATADGLAEMARYQDIARGVLSASDGRTVQNLSETIGGVNSPEGKALRAALMNNISDAVVEVKRGIPTLNRSGLSDILQKMEQNGSSRFLTKADREALNDLDRYMDLVKGVPDVGTSLMRASIVKQLRELNVKAAVDIVQAWSVGRLMTTSQGRRFLMGTGRDKMSFNNLRLLGAATATIAADSEALGTQDGD